MKLHIGEWYENRWQPLCQVYGRVFGIKSGNQGGGRCRACGKLARLLEIDPSDLMEARL